jgi:hypothetical protein
MEMNMDLTMARKRRSPLGTVARVAGMLLLAFLIVDGIMSVTMGGRWLEVQKAKLPPKLARGPRALQRLPDPAFRALGGAQAVAAATGLLKIK